MDAAAMVSAVFTRSNRIEPEPAPSMDNDLLARRLRLPGHVLVDVSMAEHMPTPAPARGRRRASMVSMPMRTDPGESGSPTMSLKKSG
ncbi:MAG: hypothetical protein ABI744_02230 [Chloroflexota bacterium]